MKSKRFTSSKKRAKPSEAEEEIENSGREREFRMSEMARERTWPELTLL